MFVRTVSVTFKPGTIDEAVRIFEQSAVPAAQQEPGFVSLMLFTNRENDTGLAVSTWESEAALEASESSGYFQEQLAKFGSVFAGPPVREKYEVNVAAYA